MKILIIYYSWSGTTKRVAENIHQKIANSDLVEITVPAGTFSRDMYETNDIFQEQLTKNQLPKINYSKINFNDYQLILVGSPVWDGKPASPIKSFLEELQKANYQGKVASFYTDAGQEGDYDKFFKSWANNLKIIGTGLEMSKLNDWLNK